MVTATTVLPPQNSARPRPAAEHPAPANPAHRPRVAIVGAPGLGLAMARAYPWISVDLYELDWCEVDRVRALVEAGELAGRVRVHHHSAAHTHTADRSALDRIVSAVA